MRGGRSTINLPLLFFPLNSRAILCSSNHSCGIAAADHSTRCCAVFTSRAPPSVRSPGPQPIYDFRTVHIRRAGALKLQSQHRGECNVKNKYQVYIKTNGTWQWLCDIEAENHADAFRNALAALKPEHASLP